jgi:putative inorganic carbon (HCO3(-)) transporter
MAFLLTLLYIVLTVLSPAELFPDLAPYRIMLWLSLLAILWSVAGFFSAPWLKLPQFRLMLGIILAICLSRLLNGWLGGVGPALADFLPAAIVFFLVLWNLSSLARLRWLSTTLILIAIYYIAQGALAYHSGDETSPFVYVQRVSGGGSAASPASYLRIRALGFLNDPNDFAQFLLMLLPFAFTAWMKGKVARNFCLCVAPAVALLYGIYLTSSRGALLALAVLIVFLVKDRLGARRGALFLPVAVALILALNQTGRAISVHEDSALGRVNAWSEGLGMFQSSPLWGIGYGLFTEHNELTAHNSFVLCLSELGLIGTFAWLGLLVACVLHLQESSRRCAAAGDSETGRWAFALRLSLYTTLATCWFLSRTYSLPLYLLLGMAAALSVQTAHLAPAEPQPVRWPWVTAMLLPALTAMVYVTVRMRTL